MEVDDDDFRMQPKKTGTKISNFTEATKVHIAYAYIILYIYNHIYIYIYIYIYVYMNAGADRICDALVECSCARA
jgi:hypothetical protein